MLSTEAVKDFEYDVDVDGAEALWKSASDYQWEIAADSEGDDGSSSNYPFILCHVGDDLSGNQHIVAIESALGDSEPILRPIFNGKEHLCAFASLEASVAANIEGDDFIVQPMLASMKMMLGSLDRMEKESKASANGGWVMNPTMDVVFCPGVWTDDGNLNDTAKEDGADFSQSVNKLLLAKADVENNSSRHISDMYYLTSDAHVGESTRSNKWKTYLDDYQKSGVCDDSITSRVEWSLERAPNPNTGLSVLTMTYNTTADTNTDLGCIVTLAMGLMAMPEVCAVETRKPVEIQNEIAQWLTQSELENERPFFDVGLDGTGQTVAISDTGIDPDNCYFWDPDNSHDKTYKPGNRKIVQYIPFVNTDDYEYGHGTHVAGTVAGKRLDGDGIADGIAPGAKIAFADIGTSSGALSIPNDQRLLNTGRPYAKIHSASWGSELNLYTVQSRNFDQYMYENDDFLIIVAAGNSGRGNTPNTVGSPATAKNLIAVGSHHSIGSGLERGQLGPSYMSDFSSRGPTFDGRTSPHILAVGQSVLSAGALPGTTGECDPSNGDIPPAGGKQDGLLSIQGTSMATPVTAGTAAIIRQYFEEGYYPSGTKVASDVMPNPSAALIKAVLMNGAKFLKGGIDNEGSETPVEPYDNNQNFGRIALQSSVYLAGKTNVQLEVWDREQVLDQESNTHTVTIDTSGGCSYESLSVTLVWVEEASVPGCVNCVLNDLDLTVSRGGTTKFPNGLSGPDRTNNAERVIFDDANGGDKFVITVKGTNLLRASQSYSLVASGCFGGTENLIFAQGECSAFECDDSKSDRLNTILMVIFIPLGIVIVLCGGYAFWKRKQGQ